MRVIVDELLRRPGGAEVYGGIRGQRNVGPAEFRDLDVVKLLHGMHAEDIDQPRCETTVGYNPDAPGGRPIIQIELLSDQIVVATEAAEMSADRNAGLGDRRVQFGRGGTNNAVATGQDWLENVLVDRK